MLLSSILFVSLFPDLSCLKLVKLVVSGIHISTILMFHLSEFFPSWVFFDSSWYCFFVLYQSFFIFHNHLLNSFSNSLNSCASCANITISFPYLKSYYFFSLYQDSQLFLIFFVEFVSTYSIKLKYFWYSILHWGNHIPSFQRVEFKSINNQF